MIIPDLNLLLYAYKRDDPAHRRASAWWTALLGGSQPIGLAWVTILGFLCIGCNRRIFPPALDSADTDFVRFPGLRWRNPLSGR